MSTRTRSTKQYKALIAEGLTDGQALTILGAAPAQSTAADRLAAAGLSPEVVAAVQAQYLTTTPVATAVAPVAAPVTVTSKDLADALVAQGGYAHGKGRVYLTGSILEAAARVLKGGKPEIVQSSGVGRTKAVVLFREDSGDVAAQNLYNPVG